MDGNDLLQKAAAEKVEVAERRAAYKLRKKLREIEVLEARVKEGAILKTDQHERIAGKAAIERELKELTGSDVGIGDPTKNTTYKPHCSSE